MKNVRKLTEGAVLLAIFTVLILMTIYIPVLGIVSNLFLAVPFILFAAKNTGMSSFVFFTAAILLSFIVGSILAIPLTFSYGLTGIVLGYFIQTKRNRASSFIASSLVFLITLVIQYAAAIAFFKINIIEDMIDVMKKSIDTSRSMLEGLGQNMNDALVDQLEASLKLIESLTPSLFVMTALLAVFLIELVSFPIIKRFGINPVKWRPFRELTLPKSILWYYLAAIIASIAFQPAEGTYWFLALVNIAFVLQFFMVLQGLSFVYFICYQKKISKAIPITVTILTFIFPFVLSIMRILGIIDLGFGFRKRFGKFNE